MPSTQRDWSQCPCQVRGHPSEPAGIECQSRNSTRGDTGVILSPGCQSVVGNLGSLLRPEEEGQRPLLASRRPHRRNVRKPVAEQRRSDVAWTGWSASEPPSFCGPFDSSRLASRSNSHISQRSLVQIQSPQPKPGVNPPAASWATRRLFAFTRPRSSTCRSGGFGARHRLAVAELADPAPHRTRRRRTWRAQVDGHGPQQCRHAALRQSARPGSFKDIETSKRWLWTGTGRRIRTPTAAFTRRPTRTASRTTSTGSANSGVTTSGMGSSARTSRWKGCSRTSCISVTSFGWAGRWCRSASPGRRAPSARGPGRRFRLASTVSRP